MLCCYAIVSDTWAHVIKPGGYPPATAGSNAAEEQQVRHLACYVVMLYFNDMWAIYQAWWLPTCPSWRHCSRRATGKTDLLRWGMGWMALMLWLDW
jgi:hypothetical protein